MNIADSQSQPPPSGASVTEETVRIERYGLTWSGSWTIEDDKLVVTSGYGSRVRPIREAEDPGHAAEAVMANIVAAWRARKV